MPVFAKPTGEPAALSPGSAADAAVRVFFARGDRSHVQWLADRLELVEADRVPVDPGFHLRWSDGRLSLHRGVHDRGVMLRRSNYQRRAVIGGELARACGITAADKPSVLDTMAGLGVDGMTLFELGCRVVMVEKQPAVWALLAGHARMAKSRTPRVINADAWTWLQAENRVFDVIYLDPMFPVRSKRALPGKAMQYLAALAAPDPRPLREWIALARRHGLRRVVVKRRLRDAAAEEPDWQIKGRTVRYDVYRGMAAKS